MITSAVHVETVTTADQSLLRAVRETLREADEALMCVAFAQEKGLYLLDRELSDLRRRKRRVRLLVTTTFQATSPAALSLAYGQGIDVRVLNPGGGTYHPKVYLGLGGGRASAVVGSANLTGGLFSNVEAAVRLRGLAGEPAIRDVLDWSEALWSDGRAEAWQPALAADAGEETFAPGLYEALRAEVARDRVFHTLGRAPRVNVVTEINPAQLYVETERSRDKRGGSEPIPAWMFNLAWERLRTHGRLANTELLNDLRVHRSSAVCAILSRLPGVKKEEGRRIGLLWGRNFRKTGNGSCPSERG